MPQLKPTVIALFVGGVDGYLRKNDIEHATERNSIQKQWGTWLEVGIPLLAVAGEMGHMYHDQVMTDTAYAAAVGLLGERMSRSFLSRTPTGPMFPPAPMRSGMSRPMMSAANGYASAAPATLRQPSGTLR